MGAVRMELSEDAIPKLMHSLVPRVFVSVRNELSESNLTLKRRPVVCKRVLAGSEPSQGVVIEQSAADLRTYSRLV